MAASDPARLHHEIVRGLLDRGFCPSNGELAEAIGVSGPELERLLRELAELHGVVLHPHACEPWIVHPFSLTPTINWIEGRGRSWWAPCLWCALGVAALAGGEVSIHTRLGAEGEPVVVRVRDGQPAGAPDLVVHFAIPPARAWANVHQHCALVLPFHSEEALGDWCRRHGVARGEAVPVTQVAALARRWYGRHADRDWRKWTVDEAQAIFAHVGLVSPFWDLGGGRGRF
jgi:hypothetical protein